MYEIMALIVFSLFMTSNTIVASPIHYQIPVNWDMTRTTKRINHGIITESETYMEEWSLSRAIPEKSFLQSPRSKEEVLILHPLDPISQLSDRIAMTQPALARLLGLIPQGETAWDSNVVVLNLSDPNQNQSIKIKTDEDDYAIINIRFF